MEDSMPAEQPPDCLFCHQKFENFREALEHLVGENPAKLCEGPPIDSPNVIHIEIPRKFSPIFVPLLQLLGIGNQYPN